jgi:hypothetical protein
MSPLLLPFVLILASEKDVRICAVVRKGNAYFSNSVNFVGFPGARKRAISEHPEADIGV